MNSNPQKLKMTEHYQLIFSGYEIFYQLYRLKNNREEMKMSLSHFFEFIPILKKDPLKKGSTWSYKIEKQKGAYALKVIGKFEVKNIDEKLVYFDGEISKEITGKNKEFKSFISESNLECRYQKHSGWIDEINVEEDVRAEVFFVKNQTMPFEMKGKYKFKTR
jgi:hypothetical protein